MNSIKLFLAILLLVFSAQSLALFMPVGDQLKADGDIILNDVGC